MKALIAKKIGMTQIYDKNGNAVAVTVLDVSGNVVSKVLNFDGKVRLEIGKDKQKNSKKVDLGNYKELTFVPRKKQTVKVDNADGMEVGKELDGTIFAEGDKVSVTANSKGKGFQGVVKRWGFSGGPRTHGASDRERAPGSLGTRTIPGRVFKGKKMGGHMGTTTKTTTGLKIAKISEDGKTIAVTGAVPGFKNSFVIIKASTRK